MMNSQDQNMMNSKLHTSTTFTSHHQTYRNAAHTFSDRLWLGDFRKNTHTHTHILILQQQQSSCNKYQQQQQKIL